MYCWHTGAGIQWTGKKSYWLEEGEGVGDGRAEGLSAIGDGGQAAISLTPYMTGRAHIHSHLWKAATWRFVCSGLNIYVYIHTCIHTDTCTHNGRLLSHKKEWNSAIYKNIDDLRGYYA